MNKLKKHSLLNMTIIFLLVVSFSTFLFTGCQNKKDEANIPKSTVNSAFNEQNPEEIKNQMENSVKSLVADGTITQS